MFPGSRAGPRPGGGGDRRHRPRVYGCAVWRTRVDRALLDDATGVHHDNTVSMARHHSQVVGHEDDRQLPFRADGVEQLQDLRLGGDIGRGGGLVGDGDPGSIRQGHHDQHPLPHAARELMWVVRDHAAPPTAIPTSCSWSTAHTGCRRPRDRRVVHRDRLRHLRTDPERRVECGHRVLEDHGDVRGRGSGGSRLRGDRAATGRRAECRPR